MNRYPKQRLFEILELDDKLGRLATAEDFEVLTANQRSRRAEEILKHNSDPAVAAIYAQVPVLEDLLGVKFHVDHIKPIAAGGKHEASNLQIVPVEVNLKKSDKWPIKY